MSSRWDSRDYWPEVGYSRPPARRGIDWSTTLLRVGWYIILPFVLWTIILVLVWWGFA